MTIDDALEKSEPSEPSEEHDDELLTAVAEGSDSAGERGEASGQPQKAGVVEVYVGEIPDADDITRMLWTARCTDERHDLLGHFASREEAEGAKSAHLSEAHGRG